MCFLVDIRSCLLAESCHRADSRGWPKECRLLRGNSGAPFALPRPPVTSARYCALIDMREILERARRTGDRREIEAAIERINAALDEPE